MALYQIYPVVATLTRNIFIYQSVLAGFATKSFKIIFKIIFLRFYIRFLLDFEAYRPTIKIYLIYRSYLIYPIYPIQ